MECKVLDQGDGRIMLHGRFDQTTVGDAMTAGQEIFRKYSDISVDLAEVDCTSTAALALLVEWSMWSEAHDKQLVYENVPANLMAIARVNYVDQFLQSKAE